MKPTPTPQPIRLWPGLHLWLAAILLGLLTACFLTSSAGAHLGLVSAAAAGQGCA